MHRETRFHFSILVYDNHLRTGHAKSAKNHFQIPIIFQIRNNDRAETVIRDRIIHIHSVYQTTRTIENENRTTVRSDHFEFDLETYAGYDIDAYEPDGMLPSSSTGLVFDGEKFTCYPVAGSSFNQLVVSSLEGGEELWRVLMFGDFPDDGVSVPSVPAEWGFDGIPQEGIRADMWALEGAGDTSDCSFDEFMAGLEGMAVNATIF